MHSYHKSNLSVPYYHFLLAFQRTFQIVIEVSKKIFIIKTLFSAALLVAKLQFLRLVIVQGAMSDKRLFLCPPIAL